MWESLCTLHNHQISHGDLRAEEITVDDGTARFGGFGSAEYGATDEQLQADVAQLLVTTTALPTDGTETDGTRVEGEDEPEGTLTCGTETCGAETGGTVT